MNSSTEPTTALLERQLGYESQVADALDSLNREMSQLLDQSGIYGPRKNDLNRLLPMLENLKTRSAESRQSRSELAIHLGTQLETAEGTDPPGESTSSLKTAIDALPSATDSARLNARRRIIFDRITAARQQLTANQVVVFYSTEFHRRYLLGVLQCDVEDANYQADGHSFRLPPEKIIGQNC